MFETMKKSVAPFAVLLLLAAPGRQSLAQGDTAENGSIRVDYTMIFPDEKAPELVKAEEENPFVALVDMTVKEETGNSEENIIKDRLLSMRVAGSSPRPQGYRVQLGEMILEEGMVVPRFLPDQSVHLRVNSITDTEIEFVWLEKQRTGLPPRTLLMPVRMKPVVHYLLPGQRGRDGAGEPVLGVHEDSLLKVAAMAAEKSAPKRGEVMDEAAPDATAAAGDGASPAKPAARPKSAADAVLDMFFNQGGNLPSPK